MFKQGDIIQYTWTGDHKDLPEEYRTSAHVRVNWIREDDGMEFKHPTLGDMYVYWREIKFYSLVNRVKTCQ